MSVAQNLFSQGAYPIAISKTFADTLLSQAKARIAYQRLSGASYAKNTHFDIWILKPETPLYSRIKDYIDSVLNVDSDVIRIHRMSDSDTIETHVDSGYPNRDTLVIRLDNEDDPRFVINGDAVPESQGAGYYMPEGTPHAVNQGLNERYSLTIWVRK